VTKTPELPSGTTVGDKLPAGQYTVALPHATMVEALVPATQ
jgi:hypothetical protein